jgi:hypothetical protein
MVGERERGRGGGESYLPFLFSEQNSLSMVPGGLLQQTSIRSGGPRRPHRQADGRNNELGLSLLQRRVPTRWSRGRGVALD